MARSIPAWNSIEGNITGGSSGCGSIPRKGCRIPATSRAGDRRGGTRGIRRRRNRPRIRSSRRVPRPETEVGGGLLGDRFPARSCLSLTKSPGSKRFPRITERGRAVIREKRDMPPFPPLPSPAEEESRKKKPGRWHKPAASASGARPARRGRSFGSGRDMPREEPEQTRESRQLQRIFPVSATKPGRDPYPAGRASRRGHPVPGTMPPVSTWRPSFISGA